VLAVVAVSSVLVKIKIKTKSEATSKAAHRSCPHRTGNTKLNSGGLCLDSVEIGPKMPARIAKHTGLRVEDL
jgi:hypothetical protein